jgi:hypothetical protein
LLQKIGTLYSKQVQDSFQISRTIEAKISATFFDIFSAGIGISTETGSYMGVGQLLGGGGGIQNFRGAKSVDTVFDAQFFSKKKIYIIFLIFNILKLFLSSLKF